MRVLRNSLAGALSPVFSGLNGMPAAPTVAPTVTATRADGTVLTAPDVEQETELQGRYYAKLLPSVHTDQIDRLKLTWTATIEATSVQADQYVYVVGGMLVTPAELYDEPDMRTKPAWLLTDACEAVNDYCEAYCNKAFGERVEVETIMHAQARNGMYPLRWGGVLSLVAATDDNDLNILDRLELVGSVAWTGGRSWPWDAVTLVYRHGVLSPPPKLRWEARRAAREDVMARSARAPRQAISETTAGIVVRYSTPDLAAGRPTGYLNLDPVLEFERLPIGIA